MVLNLISGPRNVSTALMYSFAQRSDTHVVDEPFYGVYLACTGADHPGKERIMDAQPTRVPQVIEQIKTAGVVKDLLFLKNMAHHLAQVSFDFLGDVCNLFLIRDPREMILSFIKKIPNPSMRDLAYRQQFELFKYVTQTSGQRPVVIDSAELLKDPRGVLCEVCDTLNIDFQETMLQWKPGPIPEDGVWAEYWYGSVHQSTGFKPYKPKEGQVPDRLQTLLNQSKNYYEPMYRHAIKAQVE